MAIVILVLIVIFLLFALTWIIGYDHLSSFDFSFGGQLDSDEYWMRKILDIQAGVILHLFWTNGFHKEGLLPIGVFFQLKIIEVFKYE